MNRDVPIPKAPQPPDPAPPPPWTRPPEETFSGPARRYTKAQWARRVFGRKQRRKT